MVVTVPTFERQLAFLARHFEIVSLGALLDSRRPTARPRCVITFDDGWRDNYDLAFPILYRHGLPATIFLTTDFIGTERVFWHTELISLVALDEVSPVLRGTATFKRYPSAVQEGLRRCAEAAGPGRADAVDGLIEALKALCDEDAILALVDALVRAAGVRRPLLPGRRFFLDWEQVREMSAGGFEVGSHGCSHRIMTRLTRDEATRELVASKAEIERRVERFVEHFAFPNENASTELLELVAAAGYRTACVGNEITATPGVRAIRRAGLHEGVSRSGAVHDDAVLGLALVRAPKSHAA